MLDVGIDKFFVVDGDKQSGNCDNDVCGEADFNPEVELFRSSDLVREGEPAYVAELDLEQEIFLYAYDPNKTPDPTFQLLDGPEPGEKVLSMNGHAVVRFAKAPNLRLSDINVIEVPLAA